MRIGTGRKNNLKHYEIYYSNKQSLKNFTNQDKMLSTKTITSIQINGLNDLNKNDVYAVENYVYKRLCRGGVVVEEEEAKSNSVAEKTLKDELIYQLYMIFSL